MIHRITFWLLIAVILATRVMVALTDHRFLVSHDVLVDDSFYYFQIARNIVTGHGMTFDGVIPTNGIQPLFLALLVPVMALCRPDWILSLHVAELILAGFAVATAFLLRDLATRLAGPRTALLAVAFFAVSPYFIVNGMNGLETGMAMCFAVLLLDLYARRRTGAAVRASRHVWFGVACGLAVLARVDLAILIAVLALDWLWAHRASLRDRTTRVPPLRGAGVVALAAVLTWLPWGLTSRTLTGKWLPASGEANRLIARNFGWPNDPPVWFHYPPEKVNDPTRMLFDPDHVPALYPVETATRLVADFLMEQPLLWPLRMNVPFDVWPDVGHYAPLLGLRAAPVAGLAVFVLLLGGGLLFYRRATRRLGPDPARPDLTIFLCAYLLLMTLAYSLYVQSYWYFGRYLAVPVLVSLVLGLAAVARFLRALGPGRRGTVVACGLAAFLLVGQLGNLRFLQNLGKEDPLSGAFLSNWDTFAPYIEPGATIGAFQAGTFGYVSGHRVVNLDGKVNPEAYDALRRKQLHRYIMENKIEYIVDWDMVIYALCIRHAPPGALRLEPVARDETGTPMALYRVVRPGAE